MNNPDEPAFAQSSSSINSVETGLTKREYFAAMALSGFDSNVYANPESIARVAVELADATLAELGKGES